MREIPEERAIVLAQYIIEQSATVRSAGERFGVSKSTVHKDVSERLRHLNGALYKEVKKVLLHNKQERHLRGGQATKVKYQSLKSRRA